MGGPPPDAGPSRAPRRFLPFRFPRPLPTLLTTLQLLAFWHLFTNSLLEIRMCTGFSMLPTLSNHGDFVMVSPLPYWSFFSDSLRRWPKRGELVFATSPQERGHTVCKRVVGIEGDLVEVEPRRGDAGEKWHGEEDEILRLDGPRKGEGQWVKVPKGHVWLSGDNLSNSTDSRSYGPLPLALVKGKVLARIFPNPMWFRDTVRHIDGPPLRDHP